MNRLPSSYRDPSGFVFESDGVVYRQIHYSYKSNFDFLLSSRLYTKLTAGNLLVRHEEVPKKGQYYKLIRQEKIPVISYPYEWSFSQLKDAALLTLRIERMALEHGMTLKDATSFNVQFLGGKPIFIDTLSFETFTQVPWIAYKQFCEQFLAPLALMAYTDIRTGQLLRPYLGNIPLSLATRLLPFRAILKPSIFIHLYLHAKNQDTYAGTKLPDTKLSRFTLRSALGLVDSLESGVRSLTWKVPTTVWTGYIKDTVNPSYTPQTLQKKQTFVADWLRKLKPALVLDAGANTGMYSRIAATLHIPTVAVDTDPAVIEMIYKEIRATNTTYILPLVMDFLSPTPALGLNLSERENFFTRVKADTILALALIHHLAISGNVSLTLLARIFSQHCKNLIIEFIPKEDPQTQRLLLSREDIFPDYHKKAFEKEFAKYFTIVSSQKLPESVRTLYVMKTKTS